MTVLVVVLAGLATGVALGALGGGGAILTVPVLVFALGHGVREATTASLVIVGITSVIGTLGHARSGTVRWRVGAAFAAAGVVTAVLGSAVNRLVDDRLLLLGFAAVMVLAATGMLTRGDPDGEVPAPGGPGGSRATDTLVRAVSPPRSATVANVLAAGLVVGFLTGFFGVGGGFVIVPALVLALRLPMPVAVGTSLLVVAANSAVALAARTGQAHVDWAVVVPFTVVAVGAMFVGQRLARRVSGAALTRAFAILLLAVAALLAVHSVVTLA